MINLDIGGGTTNTAEGKNGEVISTGSLFVGARHVQFVPGSYRIVSVSTFAQSLFEHLGIAAGPGDTLSETQVAAILDFYVELLESAISGNMQIFDEPVARPHQDVAFRLPDGVHVHDPIVTISGGVELVYERFGGKPLPSTTSFGDLGVDLAERFINSVALGADQSASTSVPGPRDRLRSLATRHADFWEHFVSAGSHDPATRKHPHSRPP